MNSIRRPRRRPRKRSVNFRSFYWLVAREGAWRICTGSSFHEGHVWSPRAFMLLHSHEARRLAAKALELHPDRRVYP